MPAATRHAPRQVLEIMATSASRPHSVGYWVDVLSGESWNVMKLKFSLKNLRERLAKGTFDVASP